MTDLELINLIEEVIRHKIKSNPFLIDDYLNSFDDLKSELFIQGRGAIQRHDRNKSNGYSLHNFVFHRLNHTLIDYQRKVQVFQYRTYGKTIRFNLNEGEADYNEQEDSKKKSRSYVIIDNETTEQIDNSLDVYEILKFLRPIQRMVIEESIIKDRNLKDIGDDHGTSESNMCRHRTIAINEIRNFYERGMVYYQSNYQSQSIRENLRRTNRKRCTNCKTIKPQSEFYKNKSRPDGFKYTCKECG